MQFCDHDSETIIIISDRRSDTCQQFFIHSDRQSEGGFY